MTLRGRLGVLSLAAGGLSIPVAALATYFRSVSGAGSSFILDWLMSKGATFSNPGSLPTVSAPGFFSITDARAIALLTAVAIGLAVAAMVSALVAEHRRERTLYLSGGYICGALAITLFSPLFGMIAMIAGIAVVMVMRHGRGARDT